MSDLYCNSCHFFVNYYKKKTFNLPFRFKMRRLGTGVSCVVNDQVFCSGAKNYPICCMYALYTELRLIPFRIFTTYLMFKNPSSYIEVHQNGPHSSTKMDPAQKFSRSSSSFVRMILSEASTMLNVVASVLSWLFSIFNIPTCWYTAAKNEAFLH